ncbi:MAG: AAA family ATPase, partial [Alphaproteobacteria bacterium]
IPTLDKELAASQGGGAGERMLTEEVTDLAIASVVSRWTGVPVDKMLEGEREKLLQMEATISGRVVGQDEAVAAVAEAVRRARAGLQDPNRPIGSFLFLGPTGVGKTELPKALAAVLFDEVEKAHPDVFNVLLQVLDDGRLTDGQGRTVDFRNTLIVLTSNLGSELLASQAEGEDVEAARPGVMEVVRRAFRPEFLNRLDEILLFRRLSRRHMTGIVEIQLRRLSKLLEDRKIVLDLDEAAKAWLAETGYDPVYGARPLKRVIQRELQNTLASAILRGDVKDGDVVEVRVGAKGLDIAPRAQAPAARRKAG